ncbi:MAG TPA: endonuclease III [Dehalococcoidia bacterium]|nr:endonuclease III [Dehalococcoidia bacterium]
MPPSVEQVLQRLHGVYGELRWRPHHDPISELVLTILSQHTADRASGRAFAELLATFPDWDAIREAEPAAIARAVKWAGLSEMKAPRIKAVLERVRAERGGYNLDFLGDPALPLDQARAWLMALPGVGPKTAACVLMFALGRPALPVDTHVYRVGQRLGFIPPKMSADKAHAHLEARVPEAQVYAFHVGLIKHGRHVCYAQKPNCTGCVLNDLCPSAFSFGTAPCTAPIATAADDAALPPDA